MLYLKQPYGYVRTNARCLLYFSFLNASEGVVGFAVSYLKDEKMKTFKQLKACTAGDAKL